MTQLTNKTGYIDSTPRILFHGGGVKPFNSFSGIIFSNRKEDNQSHKLTAQVMSSKKVEELTLYVIELKKEINQLKKERDDSK